MQTWEYKPAPGRKTHLKPPEVSPQVTGGMSCGLRSPMQLPVPGLRPGLVHDVYTARLQSLGPILYNLIGNGMLELRESGGWEGRGEN